LNTTLTLAAKRLRLTHLTYIGYALKDANARAVMHQFVNGQIGFEQPAAELDRLAQQDLDSFRNGGPVFCRFAVISTTLSLS